jgi:hypothetical protein
MRKGGEPADDHTDAINEDLSRILLGEFLLLGAHVDMAGPSEDVRRQARPLLEELTRIARRIEWDTGRSADEVQTDGRRLRQIAATLTDLLAPSCPDSAAA